MKDNQLQKRPHTWQKIGFILFLFLLSLTFIPTAHANNGQLINTEQDLKPSSIALSLNEQIMQLPDALFMTNKDRMQADKLLSRTLKEIKQETQLFSNTLTQYQTNFDLESWQLASQSYLTLRHLNQSKEKLLTLVHKDIYRKITRFSSYGVIQFKNELNLTKLNAQYIFLYQIQSFKSFLNEVSISPIPVIFTFFKVFLILFCLRCWLKNSRSVILHFRDNHLIKPTKPSFLAQLIWYVSKAHKPMTWLIAITLSLKIISNLTSFEHIQVLNIFIWWVLGGSIAVQLILEFANRNHRHFSKSRTNLILSSIRIYVWSLIVTGMILQFAHKTIGKGTIYHWILIFALLWFILITIYTLHKWKPYILTQLKKYEDSDFSLWVKWAIRSQHTFGFSTISMAAIVIWLTIRNIKQYILINLSQYSFFSQAIAYLFRIEIAKQNESNHRNANLEKLTKDEVFQYVLPGHEKSELINYAQAEIEQLSRYMLSDSPAICVVSGERGIGTTTLLKQLLYQANNATQIYINCPNDGYQQLIPKLALELGLDESATDIQVLAHLRKTQNCYMIAIDNTQRLVKPMVGGLAELIRFTNLMRRSKQNHRIIMAIEQSSWRFVDRARGERLLFDLVTFMPRWTEHQINQLLDSRLAPATKYPLSFDGVTLPKQWDRDDLTEDERIKMGFYRILWHYSDGNPTVSLRFFRLSLRRDKHTNQVIVCLFQPPSSEELDNMQKPMLAILRSIVQLEVSTPEELSACTQLTIAEVIGTLRFFESRGYIEWTGDKARISDHWYRFITNTLHRQHLLVK